MTSDTSAEQPMEGFRGRIQNGLVVFDQPVPLPEGTEVRVEPVVARQPRTLAERFRDVIGVVADLPTDMARNHDHYIHGTPRQ